MPSASSTPPLGPAFHRFWAGSLASNLADGVMPTASQETAQDVVGAPPAGLLSVVAALPPAVNSGAYLLGALILMGLPPAARRAARGGPRRGCRRA